MQNKQPKTRPEFYTLLYAFGQYYLQVFPGKTASFLEYLSFLTKYAAKYPISVLIKLDNSIHHFFVQRPLLNWDVTRPEIDHYVKDTDIELSKLKEAESKAKSKQSQNAQKQSKCTNFHHSGSFRPSSNAFNDSYHQPFKKSYGRSSYNQGGGGQTRGYDPKEKCCHNWNFKFCQNDLKCFRDHISYECSDPGHKADDCPYYYHNH